MLEVDPARTAKIVFLAAEHRGEDGKPFVRLDRGGGAGRHGAQRGQARQSLRRGRAAPDDPRGDRRHRGRRRLRVADRADRRRGRRRRARDGLAEPRRRRQRGRLAPPRHERRDGTGKPDVVADIVAADDGDGCSVCGEPLRTARGVEVGNIFKLGTHYAESFGATYLDPDGNAQPIVMGCYGIGVGRLLACIAEEHHDDRGLRLPVAIAPLPVHLTVLRGGDSPAGEAAERVYESLEAAGIGVLFDDRGERPGVQFADADLIGLPLRLTVSERSLSAGGVELKRRDADETRIVAEEALVAEVRAELGTSA